MTEPVLLPAVLDSLRQLTGPGEPDVLLQILAIYQEDVPGRLAKLEAALAAGDVPTAYLVAHSIKGSAGNIGARRLQHACRVAEDAARQGDLEAARAALRDVKDEAALVDQAIATLLAARQHL